RRQWYEAAGDVSAGNGHGAYQGTFRIWFFQSQLETHHKIDPALRVLAQSLDDRPRLVPRQTIGFKYLSDLTHFLFGNLGNFILRSFALALVMQSIALSSEVATEAHGN